MDEYAGRVLAGRYRLPRPPADAFELVETRAFDTYSGQEVLVRQVLLPEVVEAEPAGPGGGAAHGDGRRGGERADARGDGGRGDGRGDGGTYGDGREDGSGADRDAEYAGLDESARRALAAARAAAAIPDHPRLVQVFDIFVEDGSLWIASELVPARPLAALLAERPLDAYRAAEVAADVLTALRALHAHGWTHRNVTTSTVLVCDDGRAMLGGLAAGAAQEALCGYDPLPEPVLADELLSGGGEFGAADGSGGDGGSGGPGGLGGLGGLGGGPRSALEQERARQNRITVVGAVTERWAPEQAHEVHENWRLSPPVGPPADLWALGSLLFRSVQGHPPYPEESAAELVQLVCAEPPAFAEECGPLRPVVESLLRPDPEERPEAEEVGGWLRSLIRSAPEPDIGLRTVQVPADPAKLPVKRRRGELVRRRRKAAAAAAAAGEQGHRRHARGKQARAGRAGAASSAVPAQRATRPSARPPARPSTRPSAGAAVPAAAAASAGAGPGGAWQERLPHREQAGSRAAGGDRSPRRLGMRLLVAVLVVLLAAVLYALFAMPRRGGGATGAQGTRSVPAEVPGGGQSDGGQPSATASATASVRASARPSAPPASRPASRPVTPPPDLGSDFTLHTDPAGFTVAVHTGWARAGKNARDQVAFTGNGLRMTVVPGRDKATGDADDPLAYQLVEPELADFRASSWSSASGLQTLTLRGHPAAEGEYTWRDANSQAVYARNLAVQIGGRYHVVLIWGPDAERAAVQRAFDKAVETYGS